MMPWRRLDVGGQPHDHGFMMQGSEVGEWAGAMLAARAVVQPKGSARPGLGVQGVGVKGMPRACHG